MTIREIVLEYLEAHGFDGLAGDECGCGCGTDDFWPCDFPGIYCQAGYRWTCPSTSALCSAVDALESCEWWSPESFGGCYRTEKQP